MAENKLNRNSRTQPRKGFQSPLLRSTFFHELISFHIGKKYFDNHINPLDDKDPRKVSVEWCKRAAKAAIYAHDEKYHKFFGYWLREQFIERKQVIIDALYECQKAYYDMLYFSDGKPKKVGHWFIAVLCYSDKVNSSWFGKISDAHDKHHKSGKLFKKDEVASWRKVYTNKIHKYMMDYVKKNGIAIKISPEVDAHRSDHDEAEKKVIELVKEYQDYKNSIV